MPLARHAVRRCALPGLSNIPGPRAWPLLGSALDLSKRANGLGAPDGRQMVNAFHGYYKDFGSIYRLTLGGKDDVHVCMPEDCMKIFRSEGKYPHGGAEQLWMFKRWGKERGKKMYNDFLGQGEHWQKIRFALQEDIISPKSARSYLPLISRACEIASPNFFAYASRPDHFSTRLAFDMFTAALYGLQMQSAADKGRQRDIEFVENTQAMFHLTGELIWKPHYEMRIFKNNALNKEFAERADLSVEHSAVLLDEALQAWNDEPGDCKPYIVKLLESGQMTKEEYKDVGITMLLAGVDTTQAVMNWNVLHLAQNPEVQDRLREEVKSVFGPEGILAVEPFQKMRAELPYLRAVVREVHRMSPASPLMTQRATASDLEMQGFAIPTGTRMSLNIYSVQNDPRYVEEPDRFMPERWLPEAVKARKGTEAEVIDHKLLSSPFSFGARMCLGGRVADLETYVMLCHLVRDWRFTLAKGAAPWAVTQPLMTKATPFPAFSIEPAA